jgi:hypothetical protein
MELRCGTFAFARGRLCGRAGKCRDVEGRVRKGVGKWGREILTDERKWVEVLSDG